MANLNGGFGEYTSSQCGINSWIRRVFMLFVMMIIVASANAKVVNRVNYGVIFTKEKSVGPVYDYWTHTIQLRIPRIKQHIKTPVTCRDTQSNEYNQRCVPFSLVYQSVDNTRQEYIHTLNESLNNILEMMPQQSVGIRSRSKSKRAALSFVGDISATLFGTARVKDVKLLAKHIEALEEKSGKTLSKLANFTDEFSSFIKVSENRYTRLQTALKDNHQAVATLANSINQVKTSIEETNTMSNIMITIFIEELYHTIKLQAGLSEFLDGIHDLMRHKLSPHIVPHQDLSRIIASINSKLKAHDTNLIVLPMEIPDMYNFFPFFWTYRNHALYVTIKFPLVLSNMGAFEIYNIITFPVPLNHSSQHATILSNSHKLLGFSHDNRYYGFPTHEMISGPILDAQTANLPLHPITSPSCLTAIFFDDKKTVKELCDFRVHLHTITPALIHLHHGNYLVLNVTRMYQRCPQGRQQIQGCPFCVYTVPCFCDLATDKIYYPPRLNHCAKSNGTVKIEHSLNLPLLLHMFEMDEIKHINAETKFPKPAIVSTPPLKIFKHNFSELLAQDKTDDLSLKRIAQSVRDDKLIFQSLAEPILDDLNDIDDDVSLFSWNSILTLVNTAILVILVVGGCYLYYQIRMLATAMAILKQVKPATSQEIVQPNHLDGMHIFSTTPKTSTMSPIYITIHDDTLMYVLITFACTLVCFLLFKLLTKKSTLASIAVEISSGRSCILIPIITIPFCPKFYHCQIVTNFSDIKVLGFLRPRFSWNTGLLTIKNLIDASQLTVPNEVSISFMQGLRLRLMLRKTIYCYLVATHGMHAFHMKLCNIDCTECTLPSNTIETPAQNVTPIAIYPKIDGT